MSRIGKQTIQIPTGVSAQVDNGVLTVKGPKGELTRSIHPLVTINIQDGVLTVDVAKKEDKKERSLWGAFASHAKNMVIGVTEGYKKQLEINGVGYKVALQGKDLKLDLGFSHPVVFPAPAGIVFTAEKNIITIEGFDKELVGKIASEVRALRKPEPYKGKGIKYIDEIIRRKAGKTAKSG
ncbi:MAG: 50S ribosomal protein L6 [Candidatus Magasanikbacteria bacterium CG11_big_fil_rev_8_21_14_0_20_39_34]|uniref:Large ribosomal subunit protein uL6 n=1 Tax=Candidatus Magasanikbacteria bacterium CG11_big_fil_rev_8_21_14_0_20_39_34 TaxID=1974653 RepID=A0A2H0N619_9BACT|nr:MAG: 50S ribosomal protein L6 [Candidatus Magasanikbacteria bacterium CG11_big_fil_rev_8_21_14_0_20_39_34]